mmetsp:Transcript_20213/g.17897  ORF Transcript_20213/g.17897 Transcript_20213/m.17897 type:complete len:164 (+) Transcript_20213:617-1108(+)
MDKYAKNVLHQRNPILQRDQISCDPNQIIGNSERKSNYKDILDYQCQLNKRLKDNGGMTQEEKRFNKKQLSAYKKYNHSSFSMIPGLHNNSEFENYKSQGPKIMENYSFDNLKVKESRNPTENKLRVLGEEVKNNTLKINEYEDKFSNNETRNQKKWKIWECT